MPNGVWCTKDLLNLGHRHSIRDQVEGRPGSCMGVTKVNADACSEQKKQGSRERLQQYWSVMERSLKPAPYLVSHEMTALDVYAAMFSRWRPGRAWIEANCPHISGALSLTERQPFVARVWKRNFE